jgi:hypothetical protein
VSGEKCQPSFEGFEAAKSAAFQFLLANKSFTMWEGMAGLYKLTLQMTLSLTAPGFNPCICNLISWFSKRVFFPNGSTCTTYNTYFVSPASLIFLGSAIFCMEWKKLVEENAWGQIMVGFTS